MTHNHHTPKPDPVPYFSETPLGHAMDMLMIAVPAVLVVGALGAAFLHYKNWRGTFALVPAGLAGLVSLFVPEALVVVVTSIFAGGVWEQWRLQEIKKGHEKLRRGKAAIGLFTYMRNWRDRRLVSRGEFLGSEAYAAGEDQAGGVVRLPLGGKEGRHSLLIGATGSGKTTTMVSAALAHLTNQAGLIVIDAKGSRELVGKLRTLSRRHGRSFYQFNLDSSSDHWNPLAHGTPSERADKLIAAEQFTEPHYKRLYQRYLLTVFTAIDARGDTADLATVVELLYPEYLVIYARGIGDEHPAAQQIDRYLAALTDQEKRDLTGLRNRLGLLAEGEHGYLLTPTGDPSAHIDLLTAIQMGAVVVFSLNTFRYPETAKLLGAAVFQDLQSVAGAMEADPDLRHPTAVLVDEFGAFGADHVVGLFQRARSVSMSLVLATQELADLRRIDPAFQDQVLGNIEAVVAHRQNVPESAELVAEFAGTREVWVHTFQTDQPVSNTSDFFLTNALGSKRRGHEFYVAPDTIKQLPTGHAVIVTKNPHDVRLARMYPPPALPLRTGDLDDNEYRLRVDVSRRGPDPGAHAEWSARFLGFVDA